VPGHLLAYLLRAFAGILFDREVVSEAASQAGEHVKRGMVKLAKGSYETHYSASFRFHSSVQAEN